MNKQLLFWIGFMIAFLVCFYGTIAAVILNAKGKAPVKIVSATTDAPTGERICNAEY